LFGLFACETSQIDSVSVTEETTTTVAQGGGSGNNGGNGGGGSTTSTTVKGGNGGQGQQSGDTTSTTVPSGQGGESTTSTTISNGGNGGSSSSTTSTSSTTTTTTTTTTTIRQQWTIAFDANGGIGQMNSLIAYIDETIILPDCDFTAPSYQKFHNWNTNADGSGIAYTIGQNISNLTVQGSSFVTLYAQWIDKAAHIIHYYNTKGVEIPTDKQSFLERYEVELSNISAIGWIFDGWYDQEVGGTKVEGWAAGTYTDNVTLYGHWTAETYQITYKDMNDETFSGTMNGEPTTHAYDTVTALVSPTKTGYNFGGWYMDSNCSGTSITEIGETAITANTTLYAKWDIVTYNITYQNENAVNNNVSSYKVTDTVTLSNLTRTGYTFGGWYEVSNGNVSDTSTDGWGVGRTGAVTLQAQWTANTYTVTLFNDGDIIGDTNLTATFDNVLPALQNLPSKIGYSFIGYYTATNGTGIRYINKNGEGCKTWNLVGNTTLYAAWIPAEVNYTVKKYFQNVNGNGYEQDLTNYPNQTKIGFTESTTTATANNDITGFELQEIQQQTITANGSTVVNIYYNRKMISYTFQANGGNWNGSTDDKTVSGLFGASVLSVLTNPVRDGYEFDGWDKTLSVFGADSEMFVAQWIANQYQIIYRDENDTTFSGMHGNNYPTTHIYDRDTQLVSPSKDGYEFIGWYVDKNCSGTAKQKIDAAEITDNITLYAKWVLIESVITMTIPTYQDIDGLLTYSNGTFIALSGYQNYQWYIDNNRSTNTQQTFIPNQNILSAGTHSVTVSVQDSHGNIYGAEMTFTVKKSY
jgi:uncharacterized repeat protein (TIGR02543 family)